ncbi:hypothetical protein [Streptomyces sp. NPDC051576]|uniref:hypothetical protein n=1 Tax=Streptomyces sp. NPDC051576 TaxID=3155803 RepID=UPI00343B9EA0
MRSGVFEVDGDSGRGFFVELAALYERGGVPAAGFGIEWSGFAAFRPDENALKSAPFPVVLGAGVEDRGTYYARPSIEIGRRIGAPWVEFPGIRMEFLRDPARFVAAVRVLATQMDSRGGDVPPLWEGVSQ